MSHGKTAVTCHLAMSSSEKEKIVWRKSCGHRCHESICPFILIFFFFKDRLFLCSLGCHECYVDQSGTCECTHACLFVCVRACTHVCVRVCMRESHSLWVEARGSLWSQFSPATMWAWWLNSGHQVRQLVTLPAKSPCQLPPFILLIKWSYDTKKNHGSFEEHV